MEPNLDLGKATVVPDSSLTVGTWTTVKFLYTVGHCIDDSGYIKIAFRFAGDFGTPQFEQPEAPNYCRVVTNGDCRIDPRWDPKGNRRPWGKALYLKVRGGYLNEGEEVTVIFGDTSGGSPGWQVQTFVEDTFEFKTYVDPFATYRFKELPTSPVVAIVADKPVSMVCIAPSTVNRGETFSYFTRLHDRWGNIVEPAKEYRHTGYGEEGRYELSVRDEKTGFEAVSNPIQVLTSESNGGQLRHWWGDLHGQSEETIGTNSIEDYFRYARDYAKVDVAAHQGNDFQITDAFWDKINETTAAFNKAGSFVTFPGYEWSGNTPLGGDRNVYFKEEGGAINHSHHDLLPDNYSKYPPAPTADDLFTRLKADRGHAGPDTSPAGHRQQTVPGSGPGSAAPSAGLAGGTAAPEETAPTTTKATTPTAAPAASQEEAPAPTVSAPVATTSPPAPFVFAHVGGRYANLAMHDDEIEAAMEVHSAWGTFEWLVTDALEKGYRIGICAASDGHKGRPGASYPGSQKFGSLGGLTCFLAETLDRDHIYNAIKKRHFYATTGHRPILSVRAECPGGHAGIMGDVIETDSSEVTLHVTVIGTANIEEITLQRGTEIVEQRRPYTEDELGNRIKIVWSGAEVRGRDRLTTWEGTLRIKNNTIRQVESINFWNPLKPIRRASPGALGDALGEERGCALGDDALRWESVTTGGLTGMILDLEKPNDGTVEIDLCVSGDEHRIEAPITDIGLEPTVYRYGGLEKRLELYRLPAEGASYRTMEFATVVKGLKRGDNPLYTRTVQEDGHISWSSPVYVVYRTE